MPSSSAGSRHVWVPFGGATGVPRRCFGAMSEAGSETPKLASRDATLANTLRPSAKIATSKPHGGGDGPRLAGVVDRRPLQLRVAVVISKQLPSGVSRSRGNTPAAAYCSAQPDESSKLAFLGMLGAPRVRRLSTSSLGRRTNSLAIPTSGPSFPGPKRRRREHSIAPSHRGRRGGGRHTGLDARHETIRRICNLIYRKAYALSSRSALPLEPHS